MRKVATLLLLVAALHVSPASATPPEKIPHDLPDLPWRVAQIPLGMPLNQMKAGETLDGIFEQRLRPYIHGSVRAAGDPILRIETQLKSASASSGSWNDSRLDIWFSSQETNQQTFWIRQVRSFNKLSQTAYLKQLQERFGSPARTAEVSRGEGIWTIAAFIAPQTQSTAADLQSLNWPTDFAAVVGVQDLDLRGKMKLLGPHFRGALVSYSRNKQGEVAGESVELVDMELAATVLKLEP